MKRSELEHVLRAAATIASDFDVLVLGSQSILGSFTEDELPDKAYTSIEADVTFFDDYENDKSDLADMHLGEDSQFHATFGYYAQGVNVEVAKLPVGWQGRVVLLSSDGTNGASGHCLEPNDLVVAKLVAGRMTDRPGVRRRASSCGPHRSRRSACSGTNARAAGRRTSGHRVGRRLGAEAPTVTSARPG